MDSGSVKTKEIRSPGTVLSSVRSSLKKGATRHFDILLLAVAFMCLVGAYAVIIPLPEGFDSPAHFGYIAFLHERKSLPTIDRETAVISYELAQQPPLYYGLSAALLSKIDIKPAQKFVTDSLNHYIEKGLTGRFTVTLPNPSLAQTIPLWIARLVSMISGLATMVITWILGRQLFPESPSAALAIAALVGFNPQFLFVSATISNDALASALIAGCVALALVMVSQRRSGVVGWFAAGVCAGLAALTKYSGLLVILPVGVILSFYCWQTQEWKKGIWAATIFAFGAFITAGFWYIRNMVEWGTLVPLDQMAVAIPSLLRPLPWSVVDTLKKSSWLFYSYWGYFPDVLASTSYQTVIRMTTVAACVGYLVVPFRRSILADPNRRLALAIALVWLGGVLISVFQWMRIISFGEQGRLILVAAPAVAILMVIGWESITPKRIQSWLFYFVPVVFFGLAVSQGLVLFHGYSIPKVLHPPLIYDREVLGQFEPGMELLGFDLPNGAVLYSGAELPLVLYWNAEGEIDGLYTLFIHLVDDNGNVIYQFDGIPGYGRHPTLQWRPNSAFADHYVIRTDNHFVEGLATLSVGFYPYDQPGSRQGVVDASGKQVDSRIVLGKIRIHELPPAQNKAETIPMATWENGINLDLMKPQIEHDDLISSFQLEWQASTVIQVDYTVFIQVLDEQGQIISQIDRMPQSGEYPTSTWTPGYQIIDTYRFDPWPEKWQKVIIGLYDRSGQRLRLSYPTSGNDYYVLMTRMN